MNSDFSTRVAMGRSIPDDARQGSSDSEQAVESLHGIRKTSFIFASGQAFRSATLREGEAPAEPFWISSLPPCGSAGASPSQSGHDP